MKSLFKKFEIDLDKNFSLSEDPEEPLELFFDDEPLDGILYGKKLCGPTRANLFWPSREIVSKIIQADRKLDIKEILEGISELNTLGYPLSIEMCYELLSIAAKMVPNYPLPLIRYDLSPFGPLLENIWALAQKHNEIILLKASGTLLYRWYEHHQKYQNARKILTKLIETYREEKDQSSEAVMLNNFAFEYFLEGRFREAIPIFEQAAGLFKSIGDSFEYANSRANYWLCQLEYNKFLDIEKFERELNDIEKILCVEKSWHARKPLILRAKIEEKKGNIHKAINFVKQAIKSTKGTNTRYPELDCKYLQNLKKQIF